MLHDPADNQSGQGLVELALLLMTVFFAAALVLTLAGPVLANGFKEVVNALGDKGSQPAAPEPIAGGGEPALPPVEEDDPQPVWRFTGFYQPVDMGGLFNTVKGGATVPLKFNLYQDEVEQTDPAAVGLLKATQISCSTFADESEIDPAGAGGTELRYDTASGQFIYNWKAPQLNDLCYKVKLSAGDGASLIAYFKLKNKGA